VKLVFFVHQENNNLQKIKDYIPGEYTFLETMMGLQAHQLLGNIVIGIVLVDIDCPGVTAWMQEAYRLRPDLTYVAVTGGEGRGPDTSGLYYDFLFQPFSTWKVKVLLERAWERAALLSEQSSRQKKAGNNRSLDLNTNRPTDLGQRGRVLCEFSRALGSRFNRDKLLELFMNAVTQLVPVGKLSILLEEEPTAKYVVTAQRGLDPKFCAELGFRAGEGIVSWLTTEGRILYFDRVKGLNGGVYSSELQQEMKMLQAVICIPLLAHGQLTGVLSLGPKITGSPFYEEELEILYIISGNVAMALRDIKLHHQLRYQKLYNESILLRMDSGVVAINKKEKITTFNSRAGKILGLKPVEALHNDLRFLPSPLGDLLYETLTAGKSYHKEEIELVRGRIPLEISTYQLINGEEGETLGSVMILDDISVRKNLEREQRRADQLQILHKFVEQLAHEIKNPMVAIQTYSELLPEKYEDSSFRDSFTHTVGLEVKRLNDLVEQLIAFSTPLSYRFAPEDIHEVLETSLSLLLEEREEKGVKVEPAYCKERLQVKADKNLLARAFSYLLRNSFEVLEGGGMLHIQSTFEQVLFGDGGVRLCFYDLQTKKELQEMERMFTPLYEGQNYIPLGLPVARKIIEDHGGRIETSLRKDKSLQFEVCLPLFKPEKE
jgi:nitrogen-specific signal transduction histidine kinase